MTRTRPRPGPARGTLPKLQQQSEPPPSERPRGKGEHHEHQHVVSQDGARRLRVEALGGRAVDAVEEGVALARLGQHASVRCQGRGARGKDEDGGRAERATRRRARWWGEQERGVRHGWCLETDALARGEEIAPALRRRPYHYSKAGVSSDAKARSCSIRTLGWRLPRWRGAASGQGG